MLVLGGARSGKSRFALGAIASPRGVFVATALPVDADMARRIARHRAERPPSWRTVEAPRALAQTLASLIGAADGVVVDCLTVWVGNRQLDGGSDDEILAEVDAIARIIRERHLDIALVSNEVGAGVHPETELGMRFRDLLGAANQRLAAACERVVLMVAGVPLTIKDARTAPVADGGQAIDGRHVDAHQAP